MPTQGRPALEIHDLVVDYGAIRAVDGISLRVFPGQIVTLIGCNGAGKTTLLRAVSGLVKPTSGGIAFEGRQVEALPAHAIVRAGISQVPEGRMVFPQLTVLENLRMGAVIRNDKRSISADLEAVFSLFPRLRERCDQEAGTLSGGEQQMLAIGRALMARPRLLMLDEPSLGIAPLLCRTIFEQILRVNREQGLSILLVEQNATLALEVSSHAYVLETGRVVLEGPSEQVRHNPEVRAAYLGG